MPFIFRLIYGFIEIYVVFTFIIVCLNLNVGLVKRLIIVLCILFSFLSARAIIDNIFLYMLIGAIVVNFFIWLFTGVKGIKVLLITVTTYLITMLVEPAAHIISLKYLHSFDPNLAWFISGLPHIFIMLLIILAVKRVKKSIEEKHLRAL